MIVLGIEQFEELPKFQKNENIRICKKLLYKRLGIEISAKLEFIKELMSLPQINGVVLPKDIISTTKNPISSKEQIFNMMCMGYKAKYDRPDGIYGYSMDYIKNSKNIDFILAHPEKSYVDRIKTIYDIFSILENLHNHIIVGDVRNSNIVIDRKGPHFIDLENGRSITSEKEQLSAYYGIYSLDIQETLYYGDTPEQQLPIPDSILTDTIKTLLSSLSLYYSLDFERIYSNRGLLTILEALKKVDKNGFTEYLDLLIDQIDTKNYDNVPSFKSFVPDLQEPSRDDKLKMMRALW